MELGISQLTCIYINSQKTKPPYYSPQDFCLFTPKKDAISQDLADIIWDLKRDNLLPNSAAAWLPWESIPPASDRPIPPNKIRILRTRGVWAIAPQEEENFLFVPIGVVERFGKMELNDPDTKCIYEVEINSKKHTCCQESWWLLLGKL